MSTRHAATHPILCSIKAQWLLAATGAAIVAGIAYWAGPSQWALVRALAAGLAGALLVGIVIYAIKKSHHALQDETDAALHRERDTGLLLEHREVKPQVSGQSAVDDSTRDSTRDASRTRGALYESGTRMVSSGIARASRASRSGHDL